MNKYELILVVISFFSLFGCIGLLWARLKNVEGQLLLSKVQNQDASIVQSVHAFTDTALALAVSNDIGPSGPDSGGADKPAETTVVPK